MASVIHFDERYKSALMEGFNKASETDGLFDHSLDMEFSGVKTVHVKSLKTEPLQDYNRSLQVGTGSRYGATKEVGNEEQTFTMTQDKSLSLSVDKGNNKETMDQKKVGEIMKAEREEHIIPAVDTYRLKQWAANAGMHEALSAAPTSDTVIEQIVKCRNKQRNKGVKGTVSLLIPYTYLDTLQLAKQWINLDSLGGKTLPKGTVGQISGMNVIPVTDDRMPENAAFMMIHKSSVISPMKIKDFKGHIDPPGLSGDLLEFRMIHDAFVLGKKADGVAVAVHMAESPIACMAAVHTAAAMHNVLALEFHSVDVPWWSHMVNGLPDPIIKNGFIKVPEKPGLGIESLNEELLAEHINPDIPGMWEPTDSWNREFSNDRLWS